ncbi:MAG TPA: cyclic nucleotide-binding domain-containing protein, partial [Myxococcota bacterium]|nr:cyclic nucleotide-binding domain-containing protein [Myxococcota bacterium]
DEALRAALADADAEVRLAAIEALPGVAAGDLVPLLRDPDARVRAVAAARSPATADQLARMLASADPGEQLAALAVASEAHADQIATLVGVADPALRAAALARLAAVAPDRVPVDAIARALGDPAAEVRRRAAEVLASAGSAGVEAAAAYLADANEATAAAALEAVAAGVHPRRRHLLSAELRRRAGLAWHALAGLRFLPDGEPESRFVRAAATDTFVRQRRIAFHALELLESPRVVRRVERALRYGGARARGDALEVLSNLGDRIAARMLVLLHEPGAIEERAAALGGAAALPASRATFLADALRSDDRWLRTALAAGAARVGETANAETAVMERLLALKRVPLFENLNLDQLEAVLRLARDAAYLPDEVIVREGDPGGELFLLLEGSAEAWLDYGGPAARQLSTMPAGSYFGEMAILDDAPRSATVVACEPARLLALDGESLKSLIREMPEISIELIRVMTARVRAAERRLLAPRQGR